MVRGKNSVLGLLKQPRQDKNHLYRHDKQNEPTKERPLSFVLCESPFISVSTISRSHPSLVSPGPSHTLAVSLPRPWMLHHWIIPPLKGEDSTTLALRLSWHRDLFCSNGPKWLPPGHCHQQTSQTRRGNKIFWSGGGASRQGQRKYISLGKQVGAYRQGHRKAKKW